MGFAPVHGGRERLWERERGNAVKICRLARFIARRAGNAAESEDVRMHRIP
tara:strand:- start:529 stop:681 length:153 start_codon:yes stop_codon:yes gene_type:complete